MATVFKGKLHDDYNRLEDFTMMGDVVASGLEVPIYILETRMHVGLQSLVGNGVVGVLGALDLVGGGDVVIIGFDVLARLE